MATPTRKRPPIKRGKHKNPRRLMTATLEQFVAMDDAATVQGMTWTQWALAILLAKIDFKRRVEKARAPR